MCIEHLDHFLKVLEKIHMMTTKKKIKMTCNLLFGTKTIYCFISFQIFSIHICVYVENYTYVCMCVIKLCIPFNNQIFPLSNRIHLSRPTPLELLSGEEKRKREPAPIQLTTSSVRVCTCVCTCDDALGSCACL